jgi:abortive infection bacteriophage resistance protein
MRYQKPALTYQQQFDLIVSRGLSISEDERLRAMRWLTHISYYRLSAYFLPFKAGERFRPGTTFHQVAGLYIFDRKLRLVVLDAIERIEVALRNALTYEIAHKHGPFGHVDAAHFDPRFDHGRFISELHQAEAGSREPFVAHYRSKYTREEHLPLWMASELISFGRLSRLYKACAPDIKRRIARRLDIPDGVLVSWLHSLTYVRNVCAHHSRLWNRELAIKPAIPKLSQAWPYEVRSNERAHHTTLDLFDLALGSHRTSRRPNLAKESSGCGRERLVAAASRTGCF